MPGIDAEFIYHRLAIHKEAKPVAQRKRKVGGERREAIITETQKLLNAGFIREVKYTTWLANVVLVKKNSGKWRMCVDYTDLNKACPKDSYPLPNIDRLSHYVPPDLVLRQIHQKHVPREQNARADLLSKLASTKRPGQHRTIIQETLHSPSLDDKAVNVNDKEDLGWMAGIWGYLKEGILPEDKDEAQKIRMRSAKEIHQGICGMHSRATKVLWARYYWPTLKSDCQSHIQKCKECQQFGNAHRQPHETLHHMIIKHLATSVEHPQTNDQAEAANKVILQELKNAYHCTPQSTTQETPYRLTYGADAMIPVEVGEASHRRQVFNSEQNAQELAVDLDLVDELRDEARIHEEVCKYNTRVKPRSFQAGDLVWRLLGEARKDTSDGKLAPTWGGPFRVTKDLENGAYRLEELSGKPIPRTWNATHLKFYFS
uniref:Integrase zinc-binding domain-containing protein n=1 Tax=Cajanus cajan TaxID=3821 RepID=A0A151STY8_CAJCA|nr:hypothetical protein KK1_004525 [Cajanus cajan]